MTAGYAPLTRPTLAVRAGMIFIAVSNVTPIYYGFWPSDSTRFYCLTGSAKKFVSILSSSRHDVV